MAAAKRQLGHLFTLLLLHDSFTIMAASLHRPSIMSDGQIQAQEALTTMVSGPLHGHDLLLVIENDTQSLLDVGQVVATAGASHMPVILATQTAFLYTEHPTHHTKGTLLTSVLLFHNDPTAFLLLLADTPNWNPNYLVLFCLNPHLNTTSVLSLPVVQRSEFLLLLHSTLQSGRQRLIAYTTYPRQLTSQVRELFKVPLGVWSSDRFSSRQSLFPPRFHNFEGYKIKVTMQCLEEPFLYFNERGTCSGVYVDMMYILAEKLNFEYIQSVHEELLWGYKENGTWYGMLKNLIYSDHDMATTGLQPNPDRNDDLDNIYPFWETDFAFLLPIPPPLPQWMSILYPFSTVMWALVFGITIGSSAVFALLLHYINNFSDPFGIALQVACGLIGQPADVLGEVRAWWARVWLLTWWLTVDILCSVYTGVLKAMLTIPAFPPIMHTAADVDASDIIPSMGDYGSMVPDALRTSENPVLRSLGRKLFLDPFYSNDDPYRFLVKRVIDGTHAVLGVGYYVEFAVNTKKVTYQTYLLDERLYKGHHTWFLRRFTPYTATLARHVTNLLENGVINKLYSNHIGAVMKDDSRVRGDGVMTLDQLQGAFIVLALCLGVAFIVLLLERFAFPHSSHRPPVKPIDIHTE